MKLKIEDKKLKVASTGLSKEAVQSIINESFSTPWVDNLRKVYTDLSNMVSSTQERWGLEKGYSMIFTIFVNVKLSGNRVILDQLAKVGPAKCLRVACSRNYVIEFSKACQDDNKRKIALICFQVSKDISEI